MAKKAPPSFPHFPADWLSSERIMGMTLEQEGAYWRLINFCWETEGCCLAMDGASLATMSRLGPRWDELKDKVLDCFIPCPEHPDRITNAKLFGIRQDQAAFKKRKSRAGKKGAASRWGKGGTSHAGANSSAMATASPSHAGANDVSKRSQWPPLPSPLPVSDLVSTGCSQKPTVPRRSEPVRKTAIRKEQPQEPVGLNTEQRALYDELRALTREPDRVAYYCLIVRRLSPQTVRTIIAELRAELLDPGGAVENPGRVLSRIAGRWADHHGVQLFHRRSAA